jgi:hypothetical protein
LRRWSSASRTRASSCSSSNGFSMKSKAPLRIASTAIGMSPCPVMKMIGTRTPRASSSSRSAVPVMPGMRMSSSTQQRCVRSASSRNASADENASASSVAVRNSMRSASRTA